MKRSEAPEFICVSDAETTGVDITQDRIITFYAMVTNIRGDVIRERSWIIDPGVEVPKGASDVHKMTTGWVREHGRKDVREAIREIAGFHDQATKDGMPLVGFNHSFDLGMLDHEVRRYCGGGPLSLDYRAQFFDPSIYDRAMDKYRKGSRKLMDVARHYGIPIDETKLHDATYDVQVTSKLAWLMFQKSPYTVAELQKKQLVWKRDWAKHTTEYFASVGRTEDDGSRIEVDGSFPWRKD